MQVNVAPRSSGGCLTCKRRKKKCDEIRPFCMRCLQGNFQCLGYESPTPPLFGHGAPTNALPQPEPYAPPSSNERLSENPRMTYSAGTSTSLQEYQGNRSGSPWNQVTPNFEFPLDSGTGSDALGDVYSLIISQYVRLAPRAIFRPLRFSVETSIVGEAKVSRMKLWAMYLGAKVIQTLIDSRDENYGGLVELFYLRIRSMPTPADTSVFELALRLSCLQDLTNFATMIFDSRAGYHLLKATIPSCLQLASKYPQLWSRHSTISFSQTLCAPHFHLRRFTLWDTIFSLAFAAPPALQYDTQLNNRPGLEDVKWPPDTVLESVYGCPLAIIMVIAKINAWRAGQIGLSFEDWRALESELEVWSPTLDYREDSAERVMRLAVQEGWKHAVLIYLYMGMCKVDSADHRVESAVQQVIQLVAAVCPGNWLENHLAMPSLVAGVAARQESHRAILRRKLCVSKNENIWCLRGADFAPVLDSLWHGAGAEGHPTTWEDYALARRAVLPVNV